MKTISEYIDFWASVEMKNGFPSLALLAPSPRGWRIDLNLTVGEPDTTFMHPFVHTFVKVVIVDIDLVGPALEYSCITCIRSLVQLTPQRSWVPRTFYAVLVYDVEHR